MATQYQRGYGGSEQGGRPLRKTDEEKFNENCSKAFGSNFGKYYIFPEGTLYDEHIKKIKLFIEGKVQAISTSQLRNIFSLAKKARTVNQLKVLRPKLAYTYGRADKEALKELIFFLDKQIENISTDDEVAKFQELFEAIVAYHKYYGGKD